MQLNLKWSQLIVWSYNPHNNLPQLFFCLDHSKLKIFVNFFNTWFSRIIYKNFHHEEFDELSNWYLKKGGRLSSSNQALPSIIFERDFEIFKKKFPDLLISRKFKFKPIHYLFSGGFTYKPTFNGFLLNLLIKLVEIILFPFNRFLGLFMFIKIVKK